MSNSGDEKNAQPAEHLFVDNFKDFDYIVGPAGSCVKQVRCHFDRIEQTEEVKHVRQYTYELVEFLHDIVKVDSFPWAEFRHSVAIHNSCSSLRGLGIASTSEVMQAPFDKPASLLSKVKGIVVVPIDRPDDCCGFGGTFCVKYPEISNTIVTKKAEHIAATGAGTLLAGDLGCLMNMAGRLQRLGKPVRARHVAEVLAGVNEPAIGER